MCSIWRADERLNPTQAQNETNETLKERKLSDVSNAGCYYGLPTDHIIEFQKLALELAGMKLSYEEAWEAGHSLVNFFDVLCRNDNEIEKE